MKNRKFWLGMLVIVLTFGMTVVGCNNDSTGGGGGDGGTFTLTGIPATYNGKYAAFNGGSEDFSLFLVGAQSVNQAGNGGTAVLIVNESVSLPMWTMTGSGSTRYSGNDTVEGGIFIFDTAAASEDTPPIGERYFDSVTFSNGNAAKTWAQGEEGGGASAGDDGH